MSDIEVVLGQLAITNWGEAVFDYLPNLMYIGGFEGNSSLTENDYDSLYIADNSLLNQIHLPKLVEISGLDISLINNPNLCYIGELEYYKASPNQDVVYSTTFDGIPRKNYSECGMLWVPTRCMECPCMHVSYFYKFYPYKGAYCHY